MERGLDAIASERSKPQEYIFMPLLLPAIVAAFRTLRMPAIALGIWATAIAYDIVTVCHAPPAGKLPRRKLRRR